MVKDRSVSGIICEFNPFHNGHRYILSRMKEDTGGYIVCAMSGNFVQRGECAVFDKWTRAEAALKYGADLVIELPLPFAAASAEKFAFGGVSLLNAMNCVDHLVFGSESCKVEELYELARYLLSPAFSEDVKPFLQKGLSFAGARAGAAARALGPSRTALLRNGNDILAVEYLKALITTGSALKPCAVKRYRVGHNGTSSGDIASASEIRRLMRKNAPIERFMPAGACLADAFNPAELSRLERTVLYKLRAMSKEELSQLPDISEGLENRIKNAAETAGSLEELYSLVKTKRYSHARVRRLVLSALLNLKKEHTAGVPYIRILGMNAGGREIIGGMKASLPVIGGYGDAKKFGVEAFFELEAAATDVYGLMTKTVLPAGLEYRKKMVKA